MITAAHRFNATPGNLDWADDAGWQVLAAKVATYAWLAREGGARGIAPDFESHSERQFHFDPAKGRSFADTASLARNCGSQFGRAIAGEYPTAVILSLWLNSIKLKAGESDRPEAILVVLLA